MEHHLTFDEKKPKSSFWIRFLRLPRKANSKDKSDELLKKRSKLYNSFRSTREISPQDNVFSEEAGNFTTLECSSLLELHKDAGILFLNQNTVAKSLGRDDNKHVQFAPTPMNKCYRVDVKAAPAKRESSDEDKENLQLKTMKPARSILRLEKHGKMRINKGTSQDSQSNSETKLVNVMYTEGPKFKTPSIPRTSTKIALMDRKNSSLPQLNVSNIVKYGSLPRSKKLAEESHSFVNDICIPSESSNFEGRGSSCSVRNQQNFATFKTVADIEWHRRSLRSISRQSCYGVSDPSRMFDQKRYYSSNQDVMHRQSLGGPYMHPLGREMVYQKLPTHSQLNYPVEKSAPKLSRTDFTKMHSQNSTVPCQIQYQVSKSASKCIEPSSNTVNVKNETPAVVHVPDKSINEVGLPIVMNMKGGTTQRRDKSPHYIALAETFSSKKYNVQKKPLPTDCSRYPHDIAITKNITETKPVYIRKDNPCASKESVLQNKIRKASEYHPSVPDNKINTTVKTNKTYSERSYSPFISETRRQAIKLAMYVQKRKVVNKICKYNSKQTEEGFSSMADDECSFNCSCSCCVARHSRNNKRNLFKSFLSSNKDSKYFFITKPISECEDGNQVLPSEELQPNDCKVEALQCDVQKETETKSNSTWYECNDSLCKTPVKSDKLIQSGNTAKSQETTLYKTPVKGMCTQQNSTDPPVNEVVENIYENIAEILNSATKKKFKTQDVKRILLTPKSSPLNLGINNSSTQKALPTASPEDKVLKEIKSDNSPRQFASPIKSIFFSDSIVLLQEIFQKLSQECKELLQPPNVSSSSGLVSSDDTNKALKTSNKYVNDLVKNLKSKELSEEDFANIIGGIAQNIFIETKAKRIGSRLIHSKSLPDLKKRNLEESKIQPALSLRLICDRPKHGMKFASNMNVTKQITKTDGQYRMQTESPLSYTELGSRHLPDGWSKTPTTECSSSDTSAKLSSSGTEKEDSKCSETELQLLENAIRLGMGLSPISKLRKTPYVASPKKVNKYKSREVLSGKGKLKLKIYHNSGLVTVHVMRAAKLNWTNGKELNSYVKVTMIPDDSKKVHWRTAVRKGQKNPVFNQKFSFEILAEDATKRLVFSIWHRDYAKERSELIGCMSFSVRHVMDNSHNVDGWYRLLREGFGTQKHFAAHARKNSCSSKHEN